MPETYPISSQLRSEYPILNTILKSIESGQHTTKEAKEPAQAIIDIVKSLISTRKTYDRSGWTGKVYFENDKAYKVTPYLKNEILPLLASVSTHPEFKHPFVVFPEKADIEAILNPPFVVFPKKSELEAILAPPSYYTYSTYSQMPKVQGVSLDEREVFNHPERAILSFLLAILHMIDKGIYHGDLHGNNILISDKNFSYIIDFDRIYPYIFSTFLTQLHSCLFKFFPQLMTKYPEIAYFKQSLDNLTQTNYLDVIKQCICLDILRPELNYILETQPLPIKQITTINSWLSEIDAKKQLSLDTFDDSQIKNDKKSILKN